MISEPNKKLVLEDGSEYVGYGFGADKEIIAELVFNTCVVGYQEIISDPSYTNQMVVMTYPLIGNYGITDEDFETKNPSIGALIVREYNDQPSNFRYTKTLEEEMLDHHIPGIEGIDTRKLTRCIRDNGTMKAILTDVSTSKEEALKKIAEYEIPTNAVEKVSCKKRWYSRTTSAKYNVVAVDCGIKLSTVRQLNQRGCNVTVVPYNVEASVLERMNPDGILISNGPGNPEDVSNVIELVKALKGKFPMFGIGLGHQIIALAYGAKTYKLKFGHRGGYPVKTVVNGKVESTSQNHSYAVCAKSVEGTCLTVTHTNVSDGTVEGVACEADNVFAVQYQPESAPGAQDSVYLFDKFVESMKK